jgi:hypothetical protein
MHSRFLDTRWGGGGGLVFKNRISTGGILRSDEAELPILLLASKEKTATWKRSRRYGLIFDISERLIEKIKQGGKLSCIP